ncbi:MAG: hypothetical protein LBI31_01700 [Zoogloeaceae bacterium]|jgi:hypothetical protein|nr:hypothetical protein [Zoogloeaceae bacterium]
MASRLRPVFTKALPVPLALVFLAGLSGFIVMSIQCSEDGVKVTTIAGILGNYISQGNRMNAVVVDFEK